MAEQSDFTFMKSGFNNIVEKDETVENGLALFLSGDNLRKGAALNAIQIAEELLKR